MECVDALSHNSALLAGGIQPGTRFEIHALHADCNIYRWWTATVESADEREMAVVFPAGTWFEAPTLTGRKRIRRDCHAIFWQGVPYFLTEAYEPDGRLGQLFFDIASPPQVEPARITYVAFELDIVMHAGSSPFVEDEDEFLTAAEMYGYSDKLQECCRLSVQEALRLVEGWTPRGAPALDAR